MSLQGYPGQYLQLSRQAQIDMEHHAEPLNELASPLSVRADKLQARPFGRRLSAWSIPRLLSLGSSVYSIDDYVSECSYSLLSVLTCEKTSACHEKTPFGIIMATVHQRDELAPDLK